MAEKVKQIQLGTAGQLVCTTTGNAYLDVPKPLGRIRDIQDTDVASSVANECRVNLLRLRMRWFMWASFGRQERLKSEPPPLPPEVSTNCKYKTPPPPPLYGCVSVCEEQRFVSYRISRRQSNMSLVLRPSA